MKEDKNKISLIAYLKALAAYLQQPKTRFDIWDRFKCILLLTIIIIFLQKVVRLLGY